jgi:hypothetical protein
MKDGVSLNEVIVQTNMGYFSRDSRKMSSSVSTVSAEEIAETISSFNYTKCFTRTSCRCTGYWCQW